MSDQTADPQGQQQQGQSGDLATRMQELQAQLTEQKGEQDKLKKQLAQKEKEARSFQSRFDRVALPTPAQPTAQQLVLGQQPTQQQQEQQRVQALEEFANETAKENALLKEMMARGLAESDVDGLEFNSTVELRTQLDLIQLKKENEQLRIAMNKPPETPPATPAPASQARIDTGGPTGQGASPALQQSQEWYTRARTLSESGKRDEAMAAYIQGVHKDDSKLMAPEPMPGEE